MNFDLMPNAILDWTPNVCNLFEHATDALVKIENCLIDLNPIERKIEQNEVSSTYPKIVNN